MTVLLEYLDLTLDVCCRVSLHKSLAFIQILLNCCKEMTTTIMDWFLAHCSKQLWYDWAKI